MVIRVPVLLDVTDNDIADSIEDEVGRGARGSGARRAGNIIGDAMGRGISSGVQDGIQSGITRGTAGASVTGLLRGVTTAATQEGDSAGRGFGTGFSRGVGSAEPGIATFGQLEFSAARLGASFSGLLGAISPVGAALGGVAAGAVAVVGAVGQAAGAAVSAGGVLASLGLAAVTTRVATAGLSEAFQAQAAAEAELAATGEISAASQDALKASMDGLAPAAQNLVTEVSALTPAWSSFQGVVQQTALQGVAKQLSGISDAILPTLEKRLTGTAEVLNGAALEFAQFAQSDRFVTQLDTLLGGLNQTLSALLPGLGGFGEGLLSIFAGSTGPAIDMAEAISNVGLGFGTWAEGIAESGQLTEFLDQANVVLGDLLTIVGNVGSTIVTVFGAGAGIGGELISVLADATGQLAAFVQTAGAQAGLAQFFDLITQTGDAIGQLSGVIGPIFTGLFTVIGVLIPQVNLLRNALLPVATVLGQALGTALTGLAPVISLVAQLIVGLVQALAPLVTTIIGALGPAIAQIGALFTANLAPAISGLFALLQPLLQIFLDIFGAQVVNAINLVVTVLGGVFDILGGLINFLVGVFTGDWDKAWSGLVQVANGAVKVLRGVVEFLWKTVQNYFKNGGRQILTVVRNWWSGVVTSFVNSQVRIIQAVVNWVSRIVERFRLVRSLTVQAISLLWTNVRTFFSNGIKRVALATANGLGRVIRTFRDLPGKIRNAIGDLGSLLYNAGRNVIDGLIDGITSMIGRVGTSMSNIASTIRSYLPFSPAKVGPLSGQGNPENSGEVIAQMIADGITQNVNLPARAMQRALSPLAPTGAAVESASPQRAAGRQNAGVPDGGVSVTQVFTGPTTSGGRLAELNWNVRFATQSRRETIGGVAR